MDDSMDKICIATHDLRLETIQEILHKVRASRSTNNCPKLFDLLQVLWSHLETGLNKFDDQLLCAVCFFTVLEQTDEKNNYLSRITELVHQELVFRNGHDEDVLKEVNCSLHEKNKRTLQVVSLMYGLLQSTFVTRDSGNIACHDKLSNALKLILELLITMAYEYSRYTFVVFKTISSLKKVCGTKLQDVIFSSCNLIKLLNLVNHNWENPITGVRDLNKSIFQSLVSMLDEDSRKLVLKEINSFYWNKAKYLMLSEIIAQGKERLVNLVKNNYWIDGLIYSLCKPGLVSAGADMYYAIVANLKSDDEWCDIFMQRIVTILLGSSGKKAIENFCNYWCLATFKQFPDLAGLLIEELQNNLETESMIYSSVCILKQARKLGIADKRLDENTNVCIKTISERIEHCNPYIRMLQFEIVSVSQGKALPTPMEFKLILNYLYNNINSDCTVLRISMLANTKCFLVHLHSSYSNHTKNRQNIESQNLMNFYRSLQEFIIESLKLDGNYQRKVTTIKLCSILLSSLSEIPKKRQKQTTNSGIAMTNFLKEQNCLLLFEDNFLMKLFSLLKDPADDIRENTTQLLLDHYSKEITPTLVDNLIKDAKDCIQSKFFYQISCGQSIFRLITSLLLKESYTDTIYKSVDDVFSFAYDVLNTEYELKRDIVKSIEDGKQLHGYLSIVLEVLKVVKHNSFEFKDFKTKIPQLLNILDDISNQFAWEPEPGTSSDFSKMSDMVKSIIESSGYNPTDENDFTKISGLQQIVLNCLWLNVKASCDLASYLIYLFKDDEDLLFCKKCLTIITHVLETSRHKGAIEAAGVALGRAIQSLTSLPEESALSTLPLSLLKCKLNDLISHTGMASVTRRGAGLSIMVHRIVSSDLKKGKPLFHYFMATILPVCAASQQCAAVDGNVKDVPGAVYIHFLTRVVMDSGLAADTMYYSPELANVAFDNLTSTHWQIRNAALQLYGALIPKLIGQKKASGSGDETVATVACDEFRTHSPKLWRHMQHCLQNVEANSLESHSNLIPVLNVLANLARRYRFYSDEKEDSEKELLRSLVTLLGSPIFTVRRLTAKSIFNIFDFESIYDIIIKQQKLPENYFHGCLLVVGNYKNNIKNLDTEKLDKLQYKFKNILDGENHSYVTKREFDELWGQEYIKGEEKRTIKVAKCNKNSPGVFHWANCKVKRHIEKSPWSDIPEILITLLQENDYEHYCEFILKKMETSIDIPKESLLQVAEILLAINNEAKIGVVWKILYHISACIELGGIVDTESICNFLVTRSVSFRIKYILPFLSSVASTLSEGNLIRLSKTIFSLCDPDTSDVDMRYIASLANNEIAKTFPKIPDSAKISAIKTAVLLLQDEDEDVRLTNTQFYSNLNVNNAALHPHVCWTKILDRNNLESLLDHPEIGISIIYDELTEVVSNYAKSGQIDEYNPFANDCKNIYFESEDIKKQLQKLKDVI